MSRGNSRQCDVERMNRAQLLDIVRDPLARQARLARLLSVRGDGIMTTSQQQQRWFERYQIALARIEGKSK